MRYGKTGIIQYPHRLEKVTFHVVHAANNVGKMEWLTVTPLVGVNVRPEENIGEGLQDLIRFETRTQCGGRILRKTPFYAAF